MTIPADPRVPLLEQEPEDGRHRAMWTEWMPLAATWSPPADDDRTPVAGLRSGRSFWSKRYEGECGPIFPGEPT